MFNNLIKLQRCGIQSMKYSHLRTSRQQFLRSFSRSSSIPTINYKVKKQGTLLDKGYLLCSKNIFNHNIFYKIDHRYFHSSRFNNQNRNGEGSNSNSTGPQNDLLLLISGCLTAFFSWCIYMNTRNGAKDDKTITWNTFSSQVLPTGEVESIEIAANSDFATVKVSDGARLPASFFNEKTPQTIKVKGGFRNGSELSALLKVREDQLHIDPHHRIPLMITSALDTAVIDVTSTYLYILLSIATSFFFVALTKKFKPPTRMPPSKSKPSKKTDNNNNVGNNNNNNNKWDKTKDDLINGFEEMIQKPQKHAAKSTKEVKLKDVAGMKEAKEEITEFIHFLKDATDYKKLGAKMPRGCLMTGPPGCGKTMMAKAIANEAGVPFIAKAGSEFVEMIGGLGAKRIREMFEEARSKSPCIIFIDEIDAVGAARDQGGPGGPGNQEKNQTLNQLLVEMDGMLSSKHEIVIMGATNRVDILDKALLRPGRFDRTIEISLPGLKEREEILKVHLGNIKLDDEPEKYAGRIAHNTPGMSGAELANICNEAALYAARTAATKVTFAHLDYAVERVYAGAPKTSSAVSPEERRIVSVHESGHVLTGWLLEHTDALAKVTIIPRTGAALGFAMTNPTDRHLYSPEQIFDVMCMALGGRAAEDLIYKQVTTGARDDFNKVTNMAYSQIKYYGFNTKVGQVSFPMRQDTAMRPYSNALQSMIDQEARELVKKAYKETRKLLLENKELLIKLSDELYTKESLDYDDVAAIIGPPPHGLKRQVPSVSFGPENEAS